MIRVTTNSAGRGQGEADDGDDQTGGDRVGRVGLAVALDEEGLLRRPTAQRTAGVESVEVGCQLAHDPDPQPYVVGLVHEVGEEPFASSA